MTPEMIGLILFALQEAIKYSPAIAAEVRALLDKNDPTPADWEALRAKVLAKSYADYVPASQLPKV